ncbi:MAG: hypothetical protein JWM28_1430 [Chitinophagaceae bacterium]|nr:hypothetical protein [Chitinophagaceae bacterium]
MLLACLVEYDLYFFINVFNNYVHLMPNLVFHRSASATEDSSAENSHVLRFQELPIS